MSVSLRVGAARSRQLVRCARSGRAWQTIEAHGRLAVLTAVAVLAAAAGVAAAVADRDSGRDFGSALRAAAFSMAHLRWQFGAIVIVLGGAHYFAAAVATRAAAGVALPLGEIFLVVLGAAAANRVTPAGIGGSALTGRYFVRRGRLSVAGAAGAVVALTVLGGFADFLALLLIVLVGGWFGLSGGAAEISRIVSGVQTTLGPVRSPWLWLVVGVLVGGGVTIWLSRRRTRLAEWLTSFVEPIRGLLHTPRGLAALLLASASTTLILAWAFIATTAMVPGPQPAQSIGALTVAFLLGSAAGNLVPVPAGLGATEAALVAVLVAARVPVANALEDVLIFRAVTFWAPAALGVITAAALRRRGAL